ncbi:DUF2332 domain-containing protein [Parasulfitobacter algicola]|uniref:DUF2332 family protein n=1 Tax=Parasulfitobacter algicola TaxID=2614809 RepID=A0ABX2ISZ2_9RHOB|nr:DUF2332 family protein [Sulfitobacter algicola]NSX53469.1 DUF2332 family protein [Sulfitobacter algicola]
MTLKQAFLKQSESCSKLGSPFMGQLLHLFADRFERGTALADKMFDWPGDASSAGASLPLRLAGGLHALVLRGDLALKSVYPPNAVSDDMLWSAVNEAMIRNQPFLIHWIESAPQTNEVRRSAALIAAAHFLHNKVNMPFRVSELGASAGLNLMWDKFALRVGDKVLGPKDAPIQLTPDWAGHAPPVSQPNVEDRRGVDLSPIDPHSEQGKLRLRAYLWPDQPDRRQITDIAIATAQANVDQCDAIDWLEKRLKHTPGQAHLIYHTIAWQYFPKALQERGRKLIETAGQTATVENPLAWLSMEADNTPHSAALTLRLWPRDQHFNLARVDFHGRWINWLANQA